MFKVRVFSLVAIIFCIIIISAEVFLGGVPTSNEIQDSQSDSTPSPAPTSTLEAQYYRPSNISVGDLKIQESEKLRGVYTENWPLDITYNWLSITGMVRNTGDDTAENVGLHVLANTANNTRIIDMIVPLTDSSHAYYGTDKIMTKVSGQDPTKTGPLSTLHGEEYADVRITIYHYGAAANWTAIPVWTNSPLANQSPANVILSTSEVVDTPKTGSNDLQPGSLYSCLKITGQLYNAGARTAYNTSIRVVAYNASNYPIVDMAVGPSYGPYGTNSQINSLLPAYEGRNVTFTSHWYPPLYGGQRDRIYVLIYHEGNATSWEISPLWNNKDF